MVNAPPESHPDHQRLVRVQRSRAADLISIIADPGCVVAALVPAVAWVATRDLAATLGWSGLILLFSVALPYAALTLLIRRGQVTDRQIVRREERHLPALIAGVSVLACLIFLRALAAPQMLSALVMALVAGVVTLGLVSLRVKASLHTAVAAGAVTVLVALHGAAAGLLTLAVLAVGWARWRAGRHTAAQVVLGGALGAASAGLTFAALR